MRVCVREVLCFCVFRDVRFCFCPFPLNLSASKWLGGSSVHEAY